MARRIGPTTPSIPISEERRHGIFIVVAVRHRRARAGGLPRAYPLALIGCLLPHLQGAFVELNAVCACVAMHPPNTALASVTDTIVQARQCVVPTSLVHAKRFGRRVSAFVMTSERRLD